MKKIPTLFKRDPNNRAHVLDEYEVELPDGAVATPKWDGTCVMFDGSDWWARREVKPGKPIPDDFDEVAFDEVTGKRQGWVPITDDPQWKWHWEAISDAVSPPDGTYEAIGAHFQGDPHGLGSDTLARHGSQPVSRVPTTYNDLSHWLSNWDMEGIVWWADGEPVAKIKRRDFGLPWPLAAPAPADPERPQPIHLPVPHPFEPHTDEDGNTWCWRSGCAEDEDHPNHRTSTGTGDRSTIETAMENKWVPTKGASE